MTSQNNKTPLLYYTKLCASFQIHRWIQTGVTVRKCSVRVKIGNFLSHTTLKFDGWPWKTIGHLFYTTLRFVQHFKAIGIFKLELQSETLNSGRNWRFFVPRDLKNLRMTLKNIRAPLLCYIKLCALFQHHMWIQKIKKIGDFLSRVTLKFDGWHWITIGHISYAVSSFMHSFIAIG